MFKLKNCFLILISILLFGCKKNSAGENVEHSNSESIQAKKAVIDTAQMLKSVEEAVKLNDTNRGVKHLGSRDPDYNKWIGKYFVSFIEAQGEGPYNVVVEIDLKEEEIVHFTSYIQELGKTKKENFLQIYGTVKIKDPKNKSLVFSPEVLYEGDSYNWEDGFTLFEENGKYFIKSDQFVPVSYADGKIPIRKLN